MCFKCVIESQVPFSLFFQTLTQDLPIYIYIYIYIYVTDLKRSVFIPVPKKGNAKKCSNYHTLALISHVSKINSKFSKPGFNNTWTENSQMFKDLEKAEEPEIQLPTSAESKKNKRIPEKTSTSASLTMLKTLTAWITTNYEKFLKRWE